MAQGLPVASRHDYAAATGVVYLAIRNLDVGSAQGYGQIPLGPSRLQAGRKRIVNVPPRADRDRSEIVEVLPI